MPNRPGFENVPNADAARTSVPDEDERQGGGDRRWEQVAGRVNDTPESEGKLGRGIEKNEPVDTGDRRLDRDPD
jgi:hypothetical protein